MRSTVVLALFAGVAVAVPSIQPEPVHDPECPPEYPYCPGHSSSEVHPEPTHYPEETETHEPYPTETETHYPTETETETHYPTETETPYPTDTETHYPTTTEHPVYTTSTVYTTKIETVTKCDDYVTDCPKDHVVYETHTIPLYTTVCPVTTTETHYPEHTKTETHYPSETHKVVSTYTVCSYCPPKETHLTYEPKPEETHTPYPEDTHVPYPEDTHTPYPEDTHVPYPEDTHVPYPSETHVAPVPSTHKPYPTGSETHYPVYPTGTAAPTSTKDALPEFTGAANSVNAGMALAGLGAIAAFFI